MLEITGNDIAALSDEDLRYLVGRLCESELRAHGLSTSAVTWGGNQNAADGGIDVRVRIEKGVPPGGFVPRTSTGFQVKKTDFTPALIGPEMRPSGKLRPSISALIDENGAYIIASSGSNTSDSALNDRLEAMQFAVADNPGHADLQLVFYDQNRLATWTRSHIGLAAWVRRKIGRGEPGWQPYGPWAVSPDGEKDKYLLDDKTRLHVGIADEKGIDVMQGINRIRDILRGARRVVRLAGLSGVGKTRLVQALFDDRVSNNSLDPALVLYTDMNDNPSPQPTGMISDLIASRIRAVVVVDNCAADLHRRITEVCQMSESQVSAITVEYDVREDEPEGTEVFRLEPSSLELVSRLIARRVPAMARPNVARIAEFSGGNARVALALVNSLEHNESVAGLQDDELFKRLFHQRQGHDNNLLKAAQACALLYSFQGEALSGDDAELPKIAALIEITAQQLFANVVQLKLRDLVQRRSVWRAVLPPAIANRLAKMALREIPLELIERRFDTVRLMTSFSRRLGYLHESDEAKGISQKWLTEDGLLANVSHLNEFGLTMFENIAPVSPELTLSAIEASLSGPHATGLVNDEWRREKIGAVLHSIAYDAPLFDRCVAAMIPLALAEQTGRSPPKRSALEELFHIVLSGTHATIEQRVAVVGDLLRSNEPGRRTLGFQLLQALLKTGSFSPMHSFEFGAWDRNYGYWPKSREDQAHWFVTSLQLARQFASSADEIALGIRSTIANCIWNVWFLGAEVQEQFGTIASEIAAVDYWHEGWITVRSALSRRLGEADAIGTKRLQALESRLRPKNIAERVRAVVLSARWGMCAYTDTDEESGRESKSPMAAYEKAEAEAEELGKSVCAADAVFAVMLPDLVRGNPQARQFSFGKGLALASTDRRSMWRRLAQAFATTKECERNVDILVGFLHGLSGVDQQLCEALLEEALTHETLGAYFPALQTCARLSAAGVERLKRVASLGKSHVGLFHFLGRDSYSGTIGGDDMRTIILSLAKQERGFHVAAEILAMRFYSTQNKHNEYPSELIDAGRTLLSSTVFNDTHDAHGYRLGAIASVCLRGEDGRAAAHAICERIKLGVANYSFRPYNYDRLLESIFQHQPRIALDVFFDSVPEADRNFPSFDSFEDSSDHRKNPLDEVSVEEMLQWCDEKPIDRYSTISRKVSYCRALDDGGIEWTPLAIEMLKRAPDPAAVLKIFIQRFSPICWSGSLAAIIESRLELLNRLGELKNASLENFATQIRSQLTADIARMRKSEEECDVERDERFE